MALALTKYFKEATINVAAFPQQPDVALDFKATALLIGLDAGDALEFSCDGSTVHGKVLYGDKFVAFDDYDVTKLWLRKVGSPACIVRVFAWEKQR